jgi:hypothetical protein
MMRKGLNSSTMYTLGAWNLQSPFLEPFENDRCSLRLFARQLVFRVRVREVAGPVVIEVLVTVMHNHLIAPSKLSHELVTRWSIAQGARLVVIDFESISLRPIVYPRDNVSRVCVLTGIKATCVVDRCVFLAVEFHDRHGQAAWFALRKLLGLVVEIKCSGDGRKCCNAC